MRYLKCFWLVFFISSFVGCKKDSNKSNQTKISSVSQDSTIVKDIECPKVRFVKPLNTNISLNGFYYECEKEWKQGVAFVFSGDTIHKTNTFAEYVFNSYAFPTLIENTDYTEIIIERDDRPFKNFLEVYRFRNSVFDSVYKIPLFEENKKDIDNDGIEEYYGTQYMVEYLGEGKTGYNPILAYEISEERISLDTIATTMLNKQVYGKFYGLEVDNSLEFNGNPIEDNWP